MNLSYYVYLVINPLTYKHTLFGKFTVVSRELSNQKAGRRVLKLFLILFTQEGTWFNVVYTAQVGFNYDVYKILVWEIFHLTSSSGLVSLIDIGKNWACYQAALKDAKTTILLTPYEDEE